MFSVINNSGGTAPAPNFTANGSSTVASRGSSWFNGTNTDNIQYTYADSPRFDYPDGNWFVAALFQVTQLTGTQYIVSIGSQGTSNNIQLYMNAAALTAQVRAGTGTTAIASANLTAGWYVGVVQRNGANIELGTCPLDGAATFTTPVAFTNPFSISPATTNAVGGRSSSTNNTWYKGNISWMATGNDLLSGTDLANLAAGQDIQSNLAKSLKIYTRFDEALATIPNSVAGNTDPATKVGAIYTRGGPQWSGLPIKIDNYTTMQWSRIHGRDKGQTKKGFTFQGDYLGNPTKIEGRIIGLNNAEIVTWKDCMSPSTGRWQLSIDVPQGLAYYVLELRFKNDTSKYHRTYAPFGVGRIVVWTGQSNSANMFNTGVRVLDPAKHGCHNGSTILDIRFSNPGSGAGEFLFHFQANNGDNIPLMVVNASTSGSSLTATPNGWNDTNGTVWAQFLSALSSSGGDAEAIIWHQGEADAIAAVSEATYTTAMATTISNQRAAVGRTASELPFFCWILGHAGTVQASTIWRNQRNSHMTTINTIANTYQASAPYVLDLVDSLHYVTTQNGYLDLGCMNAQAVLSYTNPGSFPTGMAGPFITGASFSGMTITITFNLNGNSGLFLPIASPEPIDALEIRRTGILQTVSSWVISANMLVLTMMAPVLPGDTVDYITRDVLRPNGTGGYSITDNNNMLYGTNTIVGTSRRVPVLPMTSPITL